MIDFEDSLSIPAVYSPDMNNEDWQQELDKMFLRTFKTRDFLEGKISFDEFEDVLFFTGIEPIQFQNDLENGLIYYAV